jgi:hypothetical protein
LIRDYSAEIDRSWATIERAWNEYAENHPIIECDLATGLVLVYPPNEYLDDLSDRTREKTRRLYNRMTRQGSMMVFIRDSDNEILQSYVFRKAAPAKTTRKKAGKGLPEPGRKTTQKTRRVQARA